MADFTVTITEQAELDGITWAREQRNAELRQAAEGSGQPAEELADDQAYVQFVMGSAAKSYAQQKAAAPPAPPAPPAEPEPEAPAEEQPAP